MRERRNTTNSYLVSDPAKMQSTHAPYTKEHRRFPINGEEQDSIYGHSAGMSIRHEMRYHDYKTMADVVVPGSDIIHKRNLHITGHDLLSMFPVQSPMTIQMNAESRCRVFEQQERAFLSLPSDSINKLTHTTSMPFLDEDEDRALSNTYHRMGAATCGK